MRSEVTEDLIKKGTAKEKAFENSRKQALKLYDQRFKDLISQTKNMSKNEVRIIYVDKNHHPKHAITPVISLI